MPTNLNIPRAKTPQPDQKTTRKAQKRFQAGKEYDAQAINAEFDFIHERINQLFTEGEAIPDQNTGSATATTNAAAIDSILAIIRQAGLIKTE